MAHFAELLKSTLYVEQTCCSAPEPGLLNKFCSCLARALGVAKLTNMRDMLLVTLCWAT
jgi:hypothetical protein